MRCVMSYVEVRRSLQRYKRQLKHLVLAVNADIAASRYRNKEVVLKKIGTKSEYIFTIGTRL